MEEQMDVETERLVERLESMAATPVLSFHYQADVESVRDAAATITTQAARIKELEAGLAAIRARAYAADKSRTFDDCSRDLMWIDDECRALILGGAGETATLRAVQGRGGEDE